MASSVCFRESNRTGYSVRAGPLGNGISEAACVSQQSFVEQGLIPSTDKAWSDVPDLQDKR